MPCEAWCFYCPEWYTKKGKLIADTAEVAEFTIFLSKVLSGLCNKLLFIMKR